MTVSEDGNWVQYTDPVAVLCASTLADVPMILDEAEAMAASGLIAVGYVSYEAAPAFDPTLKVLRGEVPLASFAVFHAGQEIERPATQKSVVSYEPNISFAEYEHAFNQVKTHLGSGDTYQVNVTHPLNVSFQQDPLSLFATMVARQPTAFACYLELPDVTLCSVSPELFFRRKGNHIQTEPMKGTRPRGGDPVQDANLLADLKSSTKDRAENLMIVDMIRNDLGRIAEPGSVCTDSLFDIKTLPTVFQQVSKISATSTASIKQLFDALFPCASVTGAPKNNTMRIIASLEASPRGVYTGAIGHMGPGRDAQFSVAIRTLEIDTSTESGIGRAAYGVGGGVVWQSDLFDEWRESLEKAAILDDRDFMLLETMVYQPGEGLVLKDAHLERICKSARFFQIDLNDIHLNQALAELHFERPTRIRLLVDKLGVYRIEDMPITTITAPVRLRAAALRVRSDDVFLAHKTTRRDVYLRAKMGIPDCDDVILCNEDGAVTETTIYNLFAEIDGELLTPATRCGLLPGTLRAQLIADGNAREAMINMGQLAAARKLFVGNSVRGLIPAIWVDKHDYRTN